jgi:hypothetical protein
VSAKDGPDEEEIVRTQKKGGKPGQCLFLLLVIFAIIASKSLASHDYKFNVSQMMIVSEYTY